jgi:hypothetical protein
MVALGIAGNGLTLAVFLVWLFPLQVAGGRAALYGPVVFGVALVLFNFVRTHVRTTPYDTQRLALTAAVLMLPASVVGLVMAHLPLGSAVLCDVVGAAIIAAPSLVIARRILRGSR